MVRSLYARVVCFMCICVFMCVLCLHCLHVVCAVYLRPISGLDFRPVIVFIQYSVFNVSLMKDVVSLTTTPNRTVYAWFVPSERQPEPT